MVVFLFLALFSTTSSKNTITALENDINQQILRKNYVTHGPILIEYDSNFSDYGFPGSGTSGDPYRIEDYNITISGDYPIMFGGGNTAHFVIQNCWLKTDTNIGIYLGKYYEMGEGTVKVLNNVITTEYQSGIQMYGGNYSEITGNTITSYSYGILIEYGVNSLVSKNIIISGDDPGITLEYCPNSTISRNNCTDGFHGINIWFSSDSSITYNNCSYNTYGLVTTNLDNLIVTNNIIKDNTGYGYLLQNTDNSVLTNNLLQGNGDYGINVDLHSDNNDIHHNAFINSLGASSQGNDDGANNVWYDDTINEGNYWSDWTSGSYSIDGMASSVDPYPLSSMPNISEYSNSYLAILIILSFLAIPTVSFAYRKKN